MLVINFERNYLFLNKMLENINFRLYLEKRIAQKMSKIPYLDIKILCFSDYSKKISHENSQKHFETLVSELLSSVFYAMQNLLHNFFVFFFVCKI